VDRRQHSEPAEGAEGAEGVTALAAMASTGAARPVEVMAEVQQVLDSAWHCFPHTHGPADEGGAWT
jgi:hypothetical protein